MEKKYILEDEAIYEEVFPNGLKVYIHPKTKFVQTFASLQVNFGGRDFAYEINDEKYSLPKGTAHFLEHMLFENKGDTLSDFFIKNNADINAYTSRNLTSYYFSTNREVLPLLEKLLDNFTDFEFTDENVKKEKKIIKQELAMSDDSQEIKAYKTLLKLIYKDESIYEDIGGSKQSIKAIDAKVLKQATDHFYHPKNMYLLITGNIDPIEIIKALKSHPYFTKTWPEYDNVTRKINLQVKGKHTYLKHDSSLDTNIVEIGIRIPNEIFHNTDLNHNLLTKPFFSMLFSPASRIYKVLKAKKLHNFSFSASPVIEDDYGFFNISIETKKSKQFVKVIKELLFELPNATLDDKIFKAYKRSEIGNAIKAFDNIKMSHSLIKRLLNDGVDIYSFVDVSKEISLADFQVYQNIFTPDNFYLVEYRQ